MMRLAGCRVKIFLAPVMRSVWPRKHAPGARRSSSRPARGRVGRSRATVFAAGLVLRAVAHPPCAGSLEPDPDRRVAEGSPGRVPDVQYTRRSASPPEPARTAHPTGCHRHLFLRTPNAPPPLDRTDHRTGRLSSSGQRAQDLVYVLDGEREVSLGGQEPHPRAWQRRRLMAAVLRRDHEVVLAVP
jgi:hypothetical protein